MQLQRRTKIVASLGPKTDDPQVLRDLIDAGVDVARINLSHGTIEEGLARMAAVRVAAGEVGRTVAVLADLPGPKIRLVGFTEETCPVVGQTVTLSSSQLTSGASTPDTFIIAHEGALSAFLPGETVSIGDGRVVLDVRAQNPDGTLTCGVVVSGQLSGSPGVYVPADRLEQPTPTKQDLKILDAFVAAGVDMVAVSFVSCGQDMRKLGVEAVPRGPLRIAKVETTTAMENLDSIIENADAVMVARGDLGNELPPSEVPIAQKEIIRRCIAAGKPVITATQMLESMTNAYSPTRAEASDVANAVWDGTSAVMLSGETSVGIDPVNAVQTMSEIAARADVEFENRRWRKTVDDTNAENSLLSRDQKISEAVVDGAARMARRLGAVATICLSGSGFTVRQVAKLRPETPVIGVSTDPRTVMQLALSWGVSPWTVKSDTSEKMIGQALDDLTAAGRISSGDLVVVVSGASVTASATNDVRVLTVR